MKNILNSRLVRIAGVFLIVLLLFFSIRLLNGSSSTDIGQYSFPGFSGWQNKSRQGRLSETITYNGTVDGNKLNFSFMLIKNAPGTQPPRTTQDIEQHIRKIDSGVSETYGSFSKNKVTYELLNLQSTQYRGMPAVSSETLLRGSKFTTHARRLQFTTGSEQYKFELGITVDNGQSISPKAQAEADRIWQRMTEELQPKS